MQISEYDTQVGTTRPDPTITGKQVGSCPHLCTRKFKNQQDMDTKVDDSSMDKGSNLFLTGAILFANLDFTGLEEYALKAAIGGVIWMVFKVAGDYIHNKIKSKMQ